MKLIKRISDWIGRGSTHRKQMKRLGIFALLLLVVFFIPALICLWDDLNITCGDAKYKNYVIEHASEIRKHEEGNGEMYIIDTCEFNYYQDVTIRMNSDSCYTLVFWGDRDSWLWDFKLDKHFRVDIPYNRYKGENIDKDISVISLVTDLKNKAR